MNMFWVDRVSFDLRLMDPCWHTLRCHSGVFYLLNCLRSEVKSNVVLCPSLKQAANGVSYKNHFLDGKLFTLQKKRNEISLRIFVKTHTLSSILWINQFRISDTNKMDREKKLNFHFDEAQQRRCVTNATVQTTMLRLSRSRC